MEWALTSAAFIIGCVFGYIAHSVLTRSSKDRSQNKQLEQTQLEFSQYKQEVADHCHDHDKHLAELTNVIEKVNQKWHASASALINDASNSAAVSSAATNNDSALADSAYTEKASLFEQTKHMTK